MADKYPTPPLGVPTWLHSRLQVFEKKLDDHTAKDERMFASINDGQTAIQYINGQQSVILAKVDKYVDQQQSLQHKRATTEIEVDGAKRSALNKGVIGLAFTIAGAVVGYLVHWLAS